MKRFAVVIAALGGLGACAGQGPAGYVPPSRAAIGPVLAPMSQAPVFAPFAPGPVVSSRARTHLF